jgi:hypothetical protein
MRMANIGEPERIIEILPVEEPAAVPAPTEVPAPEREPDPEEVPA